LVGGAVPGEEVAEGGGGRGAGAAVPWCECVGEIQGADCGEDGRRVYRREVGGRCIRCDEIRGRGVGEGAIAGGDGVGREIVDGRGVGVDRIDDGARDRSGRDGAAGDCGILDSGIAQVVYSLGLGDHLRDGGGLRTLLGGLERDERAHLVLKRVEVGWRNAALRGDGVEVFHAFDDGILVDNGLSSAFGSCRCRSECE